MTLNVSDLSQTAAFTRVHQAESNPLAALFVEPGGSGGEIALGAGAAVVLLAGEASPRLRPWTRAVAVAMIAFHAEAVFHNERMGWNVPAVVLPVVMVRW